MFEPNVMLQATWVSAELMQQVISTELEAIQMLHMNMGIRVIMYCADWMQTHLVLVAAGTPCIPHKT